MVGVSDVQDSKDPNHNRNTSMRSVDYENPAMKGQKEVSFRQRPSIIDSLMVTKVEEPPPTVCTIPENQDGNDVKSLEQQPLSGVQDEYALYEEDISAMPTLASFLNSFTMPGQPEKDARDNSKKKPKLGLLLGVYLPTIQHIFGVLMFLRLFWIVGLAGVGEAFFIVFICCLCTFLTSISMSAIATNGVVESGGSYFMLSRNLGPEFGSAVGILFYLANAFATSMYLVGGVEILLTYVAPNLPQFKSGEYTTQADMYNNYRVYASILLFIEFIVVAMGVRVVQLFAPVSLFAVIVSIFSIYIGSFIANPSDSVNVCRVGDTLLQRSFLKTLAGNSTLSEACNSTVLQNYCRYSNDSMYLCETLLPNVVPQWVPGVTGYASGVIRENLGNLYTKNKEVLPNIKANKHVFVIQDKTSTFFILLAIYFPSVTGIMTGSNMSGDLADPQRSIPLGTIAAQLTTSFVYLSFIFVFGSTIINPLLRDKLGESLGGGMVVAQLAWPSEWVLLIGSFLSTFGAALQCLCSAPRLLQSIAKDDVIPLLAPFSVVTKRHEPFRALLISTLLAEVGVLIGAIDMIAPILDFFFLVCYAFVNFACALQTILGTPNWRPRFHFYHWSLSLLGAALAIFIMFATHWDYALISILLCAIIYKYVEYRGAKKEWGDGIRGLALAGARYSLLSIDDGDTHTKNWRPQFIILTKLNDEDQPKYLRLMTLAGQLKAGRGLIMSAAVIVGDYADASIRTRCKKVQENLKKAMADEKAKGFAQAIICNDEAEGISVLVQSAGVAALRPNTVIVGWPNSWKKDRNNPNYYNFLDAVHRVATTDKCLIIPKGITSFPDNTQRLSGTIDVWWIIHDGGLLLLLPFLLRQHRVWRNCRLRLYAVATWKDNTESMKNDLNRWLYQLRIDASVSIVELPDTDMTAYTFQKTLQMEERVQFLKELQINEKEENPQMILDKKRLRSPMRLAVLDNDKPKEEEDENVQIAFNEYTFSPSYSMSDNTLNMEATTGTTSSATESIRTMKSADGHLSPKVPSSPTVSKKNMKKMHNAVRLNEVIKERSQDSSLVIINLPGPPKHRTGLTNYLDYLEVLTDGLQRVLLVRGTGKEVITMYS